MPDSKQINKELDFLTDRISSRVWTISVGVLAFGLTLIIESIGQAESEAFLEPHRVAVPMIVALLALVADFAKYITGYISVSGTRNKLLVSELNEIAYDRDGFWYQVRVGSFYAKAVFCSVAVAWLVFVVGRRTLDLL